MTVNLLRDLVSAFAEAREATPPELRVREIGVALSVDEGIVAARGLPEVTSEEIVEFAGGALGFVVELQPDRFFVAMLDSDRSVTPGTMLWRSGHVLGTPVGDALMGRVVDPLGRPLDGGAPIEGAPHKPIERLAPSLTERAPITEPLHTGLTVVDAMVPIGRGQRELILGDRGTGKTALALDAILHQRSGDVVCIYCAIGQQAASVARVIAKLRARGAMAHTVVVVAESSVLPGLRFVAPYAAMTIAESFAEQGRDALIVFDDLTQHAQCYRELTLLLRRPAGREAFPGDIFYVHSRLLERATHWRAEFGGGSLTALPIVETEAEDLAAYIPTNIVSITDGQIYLSPTLAQKGMFPAVDVGRSVSRVGGKAQLPTYRKVSSKLKLAYAQYEELEHFARFGTRMDEETRRALEHGRLVREILKQAQSATLRPALQIFALDVTMERLLEGLTPEHAAETAHAVAAAMLDHNPALVERIEAGEALSPDALAEMRGQLKALVEERRAAAR